MKENPRPPAFSFSKAGRPRRATLDDIRAIEGNGHLDDKEAQGILDSIRQFAALMASIIQNNYGHE